MAIVVQYIRAYRRTPRSIFSIAGFFTVFGLLFSFAHLAFATDFSSSNFIVRDPVSAGGGGFATSSSFQLWGSFSQNAQGKSTSNSNEVRSGFLYFPAPAATTPPTTPPATTPPPSGGGSGSQTTPITPGLPGGLPVIIPPIISIIIGDELPPVCSTPAPIRSDFNCDGAVDLRDLSILLTRPKFVTGRILSYLFSDWTKRLPIPAGAENVALGSNVLKPDTPSSVASVEGTVGGSGGEQEPQTKKGLFSVVGAFFRVIGAFILRLFGF